MRPLEFCSKRAGTGSLEPARPLGRTLNGAYGDHGRADGGNRGRQPGLPRPHLSFDRQASPAGASIGARHPRSVRTGGGRLARIPVPGLITIGGVYAFRWEIASTRCRKRRPIAFCRRKATACTRSRSVPCMPASSSLGISALPPAEKPWSGWKQRLGYTHKGIEGLMVGADLRAGRPTRRTRIRRQHGRLCLCLFARSRGRAGNCGA